MQDEEDDMSGNTAKTMNNSNILIEILIQKTNFYGQDSRLVIIRNISYVAKQEKLQSEYEYQQALV